MYSQFIYYILVILIISVYQGNAETTFSFPLAFLLFFLLIAGFAALTRIRFEAVSKKIESSSLAYLDYQFSRVLTQQTIAAIFLLVFILYGLHLPDFLFSIRLFTSIPTFIAVTCLAVFVGFMAIIWKYSYKLYSDIYHNDLDFAAYAKSNIAFALPVIIPWLILSVLIDLLALISHQSDIFSGVGETILYMLFIGSVLVFGPSLIQRLWGCKPLETGHERQRIADLCERAGLEFTDILYWPIYGGKMITAGIMGFIKTSRYIFVTPALLKMLSLDEIDTVIAHEIGHVKKRHMFFYLLLLSGYMFFVYALSNIGILMLIHWGFSPNVLFSLNNELSDFSTLIYISFIAATFVLYFRFVFGFFMRNFERQADAYVFQLFDNADPLIRTFEKIALTSGIPADKPNWHHFSIKDRISFLLQCEADRKQILRHNKKVQKGLQVFLGILMLTGFVEYGVANSEISKGLLAEAYKEAYIDQVLLEIQKDPENPELYAALGDLYLYIEAYGKAESAYQGALSINSGNPHVLNNLAWLYVTCPDKSIKDPVQALELAKKAARLSQTPEILDTLAESLYANGLFEEATEAGRKAIALARKNPTAYQSQMDHYESQLFKFKQAEKR